MEVFLNSSPKSNGINAIGNRLPSTLTKTKKSQSELISEESDSSESSLIIVRVLKRFKEENLFDFAFSADFKYLLVTSSESVIVFDSTEFLSIASYNRLFKISEVDFDLMLHSRKINFLTSDTFVVTSQGCY